MGSREMPAWLTYLLLASGGIALFFLVPDGLFQAVTYEAVGISAAVAIAAGIRINRPRRPLPWRAFLLAQLAFVAADVAWHTVTVGRRVEVGFVSWDEPLYLVAYTLSVAAALLFVRSGTARQARAEIVDGTIIALGLGLVVWILFVKPYVQDPSLSHAAHAVAIGYAIEIVLGASFFIRLGFSSRARAPAYWLIDLSLLCVVLAYGLYSASSTYRVGTLPDAAWALAYVLRAAAALHPSMRSLTEPQPEPELGLTRRRLALFAAAGLAAPATLAVQAGDIGPQEVVVTAAIGTAAFLLVLVRMSGLIRDYERKGDELRKTVDALRSAEQQRRRLSSELVQAQEEERKRIATDIHDDPVQAMTAIGIRLQILRQRTDDPEQLRLVGQLDEAVQNSIGRLRRLMFELHPPALDRHGLASSIEEYLSTMRDDGEVTFGVEELLAVEPPEEIRIMLYRIAQEAIANVRKHAGQCRVDVRLESRDGGVYARVRDDGRAFDPIAEREPRPGHLGLLAMRERAEAAGGWLRLDSAVGRGTTVEFWLPV